MTLDKKSLRAEFLATREKLDAAYIITATQAFTERLMYEMPASSIIAGYLTIRGEIDVRTAMNLLAERGHRLCLPVAMEKDAPLLFRNWEPGLVLDKDRHGVEIPQDCQPERMPDIVIVPLVAFDKAGHRLGYGAGYYDRTIAALRRQKKDIRVVGAAYSIQQAEHIPHSAHDERLDAVVTEKQIIRFA